MRRGCWPTWEVLVSEGRDRPALEPVPSSCRVHAALPRCSEGQSRTKHGPDLPRLLLPKSRDLSFCAKQTFMQVPAVAPWRLATLTLLAFSGKPLFQVAPSLKERSHSWCTAGIFWFCLVLAHGEEASLRCAFRLLSWSWDAHTHTGLGPLQYYLSKSFAMLVTPDVGRTL